MKPLFASAVFLTAFSAASAQTPQYVSPADAGPHGSAPGMQVKQLSASNGRRDYAVIFRPGDEPYAGLTLIEPNAQP